MAQTNLSPEALAWLRANQTINGGAFTDPTTGLSYAPLLSQAGAQGEAGYGNAPELAGYYGFTPGKSNTGDAMHLYGTDGQYQNTGEFESGDSKWMLPAMLALTGLGMTMLPGGVFAGGSGAGGAAAGMDGAAFGDAGLMYGGADAASASTLGGGYMGGAGGVGAGGAALGGSAGGAALGGGATTAATTAAGSLIPGISDKALGIGATVLGGLAGNEGTPGQTAERKMDSRLDQYVYGDLLPQAKGLLGQQMPMAQQYGNQMMQMGSGLLGAGIAPNGFERFTRGRY